MTWICDECLCLGCRDRSDANQGTDGANGMPTCLEDKRQIHFVDANNNYKIVYYRGSYTNGEFALQMAGHDQNSIGEPRFEIKVNDSLQSWLDDDNVIFNASFPESFKCVISGPSECGKTFL